jgi:hypothetical protein
VNTLGFRKKVPSHKHGGADEYYGYEADFIEESEIPVRTLYVQNNEGKKAGN